MNAKVIFGLFVAVAAAQVAVPLGQIWKHEDILKTGKTYKFKCAPVDPYDAFRGRYVALNYADTVTTSKEPLSYRSPAYVALTADAQGFAKFGELTTAVPARGDYLRVEYQWGGKTNAQFRLPFDKFFMEETKAPRAETAYREFSRRDLPPCYVVVHVKGGRGVIENLYIKDQPIREFLAKDSAKTQP